MKRSVIMQSSRSAEFIDRRRFIAGSAGALILSACSGSSDESENRDESLPVFVQQHYRQQLKEVTARNLSVTGTVPSQLSGMYVRNGHNPKPELVPPFWFGGNGMLHGVHISGGKAEWYRNRFVQTPALSGAPLMQGDGSVDLTASAAATSIYAHAGKVYALQEVNLPFLIGPELQTLGPYDFGGKLTVPMTAHPKIDPVTGEMLFISYGSEEPYLTYFRVSPKGNLTDAEPIMGSGRSLMHDFAVTPNYVVFLDCSAAFDPASQLSFPYAWNSKYQAQIGVMPRDRSKGPIKWYPVDPFSFFHVANAWEDADGTIQFESTLYDKPAWDLFSKWLMSLPGHADWLVQGDKFARWTIDLKAETVTREVRTDIACDFPTINQTFLGRRTRYTYAEAFPGGLLTKNALLKIDGETGEVLVREYPEGQQPEEPWFVPDPHGTSEDDGWLFSYVSDIKTGRSELHIIDASRFTARPTAVIEIPGWVPAGVHGSWIDDAVFSPSTT